MLWGGRSLGRRQLDDIAVVSEYRGCGGTRQIGLDAALPSNAAWLPMSWIIWDRAGNPTQYVSDALNIQRFQLRAALHKIKARSDLGGRDRVIVYDDGRVTDINGEDIGNIHDEF